MTVITNTPRAGETAEQTATRSATRGATILNAHIWDREPNEHYVEEFWCSERLFQEEKFEGGIWDQCCGFGRIVISALKTGHVAAGSDIIDRGWDSTLTPHDFLTSTNTAQNIVCNPPFNIASKFAQQAVKLAFAKAALVFPVARLNAAHWLRELPLRRVWLMTPRPSMPPGHTITAGEKPSGGKSDFCWIIFEKGFEGTPELRWLRRDA